MSPNNVCPSCGAALEENAGSSCPFCGSALSLSMSAPTIISAPAKKKKAAAKSSAEAMDEVKKLVREGDTTGAAEVASAEFGLDQEAAQSTVEQVATNMKYSAPEPVIVEPIPDYKPSEPVIESSPFDEPQKPSNSRPWIIGCSIAAVVFLCVCCCLPLVFGLISMANNR
jgi:uncharacterized Zn finger protein (UPF0148 family)